MIYRRFTMFFLYIQVIGSNLDIPWTLVSMNQTVTIYDDDVFDPLKPVEQSIQKLNHFLLTHNYDCLISHLYVPEISDLCERYHFKYIGWIYDSPLVSLFHPSVRNNCNYLFIFDRTEYEFFSTQGIPHLYYLPLATNILRTGTLDITEEDEQTYNHDISFIGNLYEDNIYNTIIQYLPPDISCELKLYLLHNLCNWSEPKPWPRISKRVSDYMVQYLHADHWVHMDMDMDLFLGISLLSRKLAEMDRITILNTLAEKFTVHLYTYSESAFLKNVHVHPGVDYDTDMNKVFFLSKINLNITLPSIETGIPQRIFDIMGCGGFVMTNYQKEIDDYFTIGKDLEVFHNIDELKDKTAYYLQNDQERIKIAMNGYQKTCKHFSYTNQINHILKIIKQEDT